MSNEIELKLDPSLSVFCLPNSQAEVKFIYREIFRDNCYFRHGIQLNDGDVIVDAGANIGMFALWAFGMRRELRYFGFEPVPAIFHCLERNLGRPELCQGAKIEIFKQGLSNTPMDSEFTFRPTLPGNSTLYSDQQRTEARAMVKSFSLQDAWRWHKGLFFLAVPIYPFRNVLMKWWQRHAYRKAEKITCTFTTLERFIRDFRIQRIDLLKIDVEGSEFDALEGASDDNLRRIRQIVMEIAPGNKGQIAGLKTRLTHCGFQKIFVESMRTDSDPYTDALPCQLYALK